MKCEKCHGFLEDYIDGELDGELAAQVKSHMATCVACSKLSEQLMQEQGIYARYKRDIEITPALWAGVEARIKQEKSARQPQTLAGWLERFSGLFAAPRFSPALAAALVLVAVGITIAVMSWMNSASRTPIVATNPGNPPAENSGNANRAIEAPAPKPETNNDKLASDKPANDNNDDANKALVPEKERKLAPEKRMTPKTQLAAKQPDPMQLVREAEQKYIRAIAILSNDVNRRRPQIDPQVLARFDSALAGIDRAISETRRVAHERPDDPVALQYLLSAYAKKVDALREMALD
jgi:putative zinc finger protein